MDVNKEIIISLTSYPLRIHYVNDVLKSLLEQETTLPFKIVLVLSLVEFPQQLNNLPQDLLDTLSKNSNKIEIIWYEKNIRSHKKLIPTLKKYPFCNLSNASFSEMIGNVLYSSYSITLFVK